MGCALVAAVVLGYQPADHVGSADAVYGMVAKGKWEAGYRPEEIDASQLPENLTAQAEIFHPERDLYDRPMPSRPPMIYVYASAPDGVIVQDIQLADNEGHAFRLERQSERTAFSALRVLYAIDMSQAREHMRSNDTAYSLDLQVILEWRGRRYPFKVLRMCPKAMRFRESPFRFLGQLVHFALLPILLVAVAAGVAVWAVVRRKRAGRNAQSAEE